MQTDIRLNMQPCAWGRKICLAEHTQPCREPRRTPHKAIMKMGPVELQGAQSGNHQLWGDPRGWGHWQKAFEDTGAIEQREELGKRHHQQRKARGMVTTQ